MSYNFNCPFCNNEYSEFQGLYYSEEISRNGSTNIKCNNCKERFMLTVNMYSDLVTYENKVIKEYNRIKKRESRNILQTKKGNKIC